MASLVIVTCEQIASIVTALGYSHDRRQREHLGASAIVA